MKSVKVFITESEEFRLYSIRQFSQKSALIQEEFFDNSNTIFEKHNFFYNDRNQVVKSEKWFLETGGKESINIEYNNGLNIKETLFLNDEIYSITNKVYDNLDRLIRQETCVEEQVLEKIEADYKNKIRIKETFSHHGALEYRKTENLDQNGVVISELEEDFDSDLPNEMTQYEYDNHGNICLVEVYNGDKLVLKEEYKFDNDNNEIGSEGYDYETGIQTSIIRIFNDNGKLKSERIYDNGIQVFEQGLEYNEKGDLVYQYEKELTNRDYSIVEKRYEIEY